MTMAQEQRSKHAHGYACKHTNARFKQITWTVGSVSVSSKKLVFVFALHGVMSIVCVLVYVFNKL